MNHEDFVTYNQAVKLKELGFDWKCNHYYDTQTENFLPVDWFDYDGDVDADDLYDSNPPKGIISYRISAPTLAQAQKWLRDVKLICVDLQIVSLPNRKWCAKIFDLKDYPNVNFVLYINNQDTYEEALSEGISKVLEFLTQSSEKSRLSIISKYYDHT